MTTITTDTKYNFTKAENDLFSWTRFDGTDGNKLFHKPSGRHIYGKYWLNEKGKMGEAVDAETRTLANTFWGGLKELKNQKPPRLDVIVVDPEPKHGENGYCRKCHSYCYSDCEANF